VSEPLERRRLLAGSISGQPFCDRNSNGILDAGEPAMSAAINNHPASVTVYLDLNNNGTQDGGDVATTTDVNGNYTFGGLADGTYSIGEITPTGYIRTGSAFLSATVTGGGAVTGKNHGNFPVVFDAGVNPAGTNGNGSDVYSVSALGSIGSPTLQITQQLLGQASPTVYMIAKSSVTSITINAGAGDDQLTIDYSQPGGNPIPSNGLNIDAGTQSTTNADRMTVTGSGGADTIVLNSLSNPGGGAIAIAGMEKVTLNGGNGNDALTLGSGLAADTFFDGGANTDSLTYNGTENADTLTLQAGAVTSGINTAQYFNTETLLVNALGGADDVTLSSTAGGTPATLNGGTGNDTLNTETTPMSTLTYCGGLTGGEHDTLNVDIGTYTFAGDAADSTANLTVNVAASGAVVFNSTEHLENLVITNGIATLSANGDKVLRTRGLSITGTGKLDLTNNDLILDYSGLSPVGTWNGTAYTQVTGMLASGYNGGAWNGNGIRTSSATSITELGVAEASQALGISGVQMGVFSGETVDATTVLVKFTYTGDANLSGKINVDDYGRIDSNVQFNGSVFGFYNGDFTYDGKINIDDYGKLDTAIGLQGGIL
jgi:hypothetical protein